MAYALLAGFVALGASAAFTATGNAVTNLYDEISTTFVASMPSTN
jgi:Flp pilus assembly pilin Flp